MQPRMYPPSLQHIIEGVQALLMLSSVRLHMEACKLMHYRQKMMQKIKKADR